MLIFGECIYLAINEATQSLDIVSGHLGGCLSVLLGVYHVSPSVSFCGVGRSENAPTCRIVLDGPEQSGGYLWFDG